MKKLKSTQWKLENKKQGLAQALILNTIGAADIPEAPVFHPLKRRPLAESEDSGRRRDFKRHLPGTPAIRRQPHGKA